MFPNQNPKHTLTHRRLNNLMPPTLNPALNIIKLQHTLTHNLQQLPRSHAVEFPLRESHREGTHFALNV